MTDLELQAESLQVELVGERTGRNATLKIGGHDISKVTRGVNIEVPADGLVTAYVELVPHSILTKTEIEVEKLNFLVHGIDDLILCAREAAVDLDKVGGNPTLAFRLRHAADQVMRGL